MKTKPPKIKISPYQAYMLMHKFEAFSADLPFCAWCGLLEEKHLSYPGQTTTEDSCEKNT